MKRARAELLAQALKYPESNGSRLLRERIALFYPGATAENVLVTTGCSEANYTTLWGLLEKGDRVAVMIPNYLQSWGLARGYAGRADAYRLVEKRRGPRLPLGARRREPRAGRDEEDEGHHGDQPQQPDGRRPDRGGDGGDRPRRAQGRSLDRLGRGLPRGRGRQRHDVADVLGPLREGHRHRGSLQGVRAAGTADRLDRGASEADGVVLGLPGLHDADADHAVRPARPRGDGAAAARGDPRPDARDHPAPPAAGRGLDPRARRAASSTSRRWPARSRW